MKAFLAVTVTEFKLLLREPAAVFFTLVFPLMLLVLFGSIFGNDPGSGWDGYGAMDLAVPAYIGMIIGTVSMMSMPIVISEYRQRGIFRRLQATPLRSGTIIAAHTTLNLILTVIGVILLFVGGVMLYDLISPAEPLRLVGGTTLSYLSFAAFGFLIGGAFGTARTAQVAGNVIYFPQLFLSGAAFPRELFPETLKSITEWLPMTQLVLVIQNAWLGEPLQWTSVLYLAVMGLACAALAARLFRWE